MSDTDTLASQLSVPEVPISVERLHKLRQQLDVIRHLMASHHGLTLEEIEEALECKRRTAQRFLRVLEDLYSDRFV